MEVFAVGEDTLTCRLQASLTHLRGVCALLSAAQKWSFHQPHQRKKRKRTTRVLFCGGIRRWRRYPHLPLTSKLDASSWGMRTPFCYAEMEFSSATSTKKEKENHKGSLSLFFGRSVEIRTPGLQYPKLARYQLRYTSWGLSMIIFESKSLSFSARLNGALS